MTNFDMQFCIASIVIVSYSLLTNKMVAGVINVMVKREIKQLNAIRYSDNVQIMYNFIYRNNGQLLQNHISRFVFHNIAYNKLSQII